MGWDLAAEIPESEKFMLGHLDSQIDLLVLHRICLRNPRALTIQSERDNVFETAEKNAKKMKTPENNEMAVRTCEYICLLRVRNDARTGYLKQVMSNSAWRSAHSNQSINQFTQMKWLKGWANPTPKGHDVQGVMVQGG